MNALRRRLQPLTWLALSAVLALALLPSLSHALALANGDAAWAEVCTTQGLQRVAVDADEAPVPAVDHPAHCPFCKLGSDAPPLPPAPPAPLFLAPPGPWLPPLYLKAPHTLHAWAAAQARAPPISA